MKTTKVNVTLYDAYDYTDDASLGMFASPSEAEDKCHYQDCLYFVMWYSNRNEEQRRLNPFEHQRLAVIQRNAEIEVELETDFDGNEVVPDLDIWAIDYLATEQGAWEDGEVKPITFDDKYKTTKRYTKSRNL